MRFANPRTNGFTQQKPTEPGVYYVLTDGHLPLAPAKRLRDGWDVASVMFYAGSYFNPSDNKEKFAHWMIKTLDGLEYAWRQGMWIKGPIKP